MSWHRLAALGVVVRPFSGLKPPEEGRRSPFSASLSTTISDLARELRALDARNVVLEIDVRDRDIRLDGLPRADAQPSSPAVGLAFESRYGPQRIQTATFWRWEDNLRAIALGMEALRAVDRYGISKRGEQYVGYRALPASTDPADAVVTREQAVAAIHRFTEDLYDLSDVEDAFQREAIHHALTRTHPDRGGDPDDFRVVQRAREILEAR